MSTILVQPQASLWQSCISDPLIEFAIFIQGVEPFPNEGFEFFQSIRAFSQELLFIIPEMKKSTCSRKTAKLGLWNQATRS